MNKRFIITLLLTLVIGCATGAARDQWVIGDKAYDVDTLIFPHLVGPGVIAAKFDIPALPLKVSVTEMDLTNPYIVMETCLGAEKSVGSETPVNMATRNTRPGHEVVAAVNGDFFMTSPTNEVGLPLCGQVRGGELMLSSHNRACLVLDDNNRPYIDRLTFTGRVTCGEHSFALNLVNRMRYAYEGIAANQSILFTRSYGPATYDGSSDGKMVLLRPADGAFTWNCNGEERCVIESIVDAQGSTTIPDGKAILWLKGTYANQVASMNVGDELSIKTAFAFFAFSFRAITITIFRAFFTIFSFWIIAVFALITSAIFRIAFITIFITNIFAFIAIITFFAFTSAIIYITIFNF